MLSRKELKSLIGQNIFCIPQGNSISRGVDLSEQITEFTLNSVGTSLMSITLASGKFEEKYNIKGNLDSNNYGYIPFESTEKALEYFEVKKKITEVTRASMEHLTLEEINDILNIISKRK